MSRSDVADELFTLLAAGHENHRNAIGVGRSSDCAGHPGRSVAVGPMRSTRAARTCCRQPSTRCSANRPVIDGAARQVIAPTMPLGQWMIPHGYTVQVDIPLTHQKRLPGSGTGFDPDRFLSESPDLYSWVPFGGGNPALPGRSVREHGDERGPCGRCCVSSIFVPTDGARGGGCTAAASHSRQAQAARAVVHRAGSCCRIGRQGATSAGHPRLLSGRERGPWRARSSSPSTVTCRSCRCRSGRTHPPPTAGQVRIAVRAAGVKLRRPSRPGRPLSRGTEAARRRRLRSGRDHRGRRRRRISSTGRGAGIRRHPIRRIRGDRQCAGGPMPFRLPDALSFEQGARDTGQLRHRVGGVARLRIAKVGRAGC